jgi:hypothetical protein
MRTRQHWEEIERIAALAKEEYGLDAGMTVHRIQLVAEQLDGLRDAIGATPKEMEDWDG